MYKLSRTNSEAPCSRTDRNSRSSILKKDVIKHSAISTLLDTGSSSLGILNSGEQSDDTENCISEDLRQLKHELSKKKGYRSCSASPLISESGYGNLSCSSKIFRTTVREGSSQSCTPTSTNSYYKYGAQNPSIIDSCDGTAASFDRDELDQPNFPKGQGCGMTCYWSKGTKYRGTGGLYSPSLSDTLKRKGSSILCGSQSLRNKKRSSGSQKQKYISTCSQGLPLLANSCDEGNSSLDTASDELSTKLGELDLEAVSRLDGRRWSSCKSHDGLELAAPGDSDLEIVDKRSLSHKYQPRSFDEVIGQNIVVQSLSNAILRGRIAPAYLLELTSLDGTLIDSGPTDDATDIKVYKYVSLDKLDEIWRRCIDGCHSRTLRQLLYGHAKLASIPENEGTLVAMIAFDDDKIKTRAERFLSSITNSFEIVFRRNVEVRMGLATENSDERNALSRSRAGNSVEKENQNMTKLDTENGLSSKDRCKGTSYLPGKSIGHPDSSVTAEDCLVARIPSISAEGKDDSCLSEDQGQLDSTQGFPRAATDEQKLESAWLQAAEKYTPEIISHSRPEKNQVLPQIGVIYQNNNQSFLGPATTSKNMVDELKHEIHALKVSYAEGSQKGQIGGAGQCVVSPSLLHSNTDKNS
ncbi:hypothetical protein BHM03_00015659 [Ensete ventricosum]|nr:hypothetical protein BHM03_00015659 [Ensete ventricosum]